MKRGRYLVGYSATKDTLMVGEVTSGYVFVVVIGTDDVDARLLAEQMVGCLGYEPTSVEEV